MKKRKGRTKAKIRAKWKGMTAMHRQIEAAAARRSPDTKPTKGMRRFP